MGSLADSILNRGDSEATLDLGADDLMKQLEVLKGKRAPVPFSLADTVLELSDDIEVDPELAKELAALEQKRSELERPPSPLIDEAPLEDVVKSHIKITRAEDELAAISQELGLSMTLESPEQDQQEAQPP